ncbi:PPA1309 family protein [Gleimia coleocanis]|nr:PPA1309 family protein [Gleimia coleocanis]
MTEPHFPTNTELALAQAVYEIERAASGLGWDRPTTVYALVPTTDLLEIPELPEDMREHLQSTWNGNPAALTAVIQEDLPGEDLEDTLAQLGWPDSVAGAAVCTERVMVPPAAQENAPEDPVEAVEYFANHPDRDEVRLVAAVMRTGEAWCAVRARSHDNDDEVGEGSDLVPGLVEALFATFLPAEERGSSGGCGGDCGNCSCGG